MKRSFLYIAAVMVMAGVLVLEMPGTSWAEADGIFSAQVVDPDVEEETELDEADGGNSGQASVVGTVVSRTIEVGEDARQREAKQAAEEEARAAKAAEEKAKAEQAAAARAEADRIINEDINKRQQLVDYALQFVGCPYRAGGNDPHTGADCSGFIRYVMQYGAGISMERSSCAQSAQGRTVSASQMRPGDLIFYGKGSSVNHVAMYIGDGKVVHASTEKTGIKTSVWNYRVPLRIASMF